MQRGRTSSTERRGGGWRQCSATSKARRCRSLAGEWNTESTLVVKRRSKGGYQQGRQARKAAAMASSQVASAVERRAALQARKKGAAGD